MSLLSYKAHEEKKDEVKTRSNPTSLVLAYPFGYSSSSSE